MYKVYVNDDRTIVFSSTLPDERTQEEKIITPAAAMPENGAENSVAITNLLEKLRFTKRLFIISPKIEQIFQLFLSSAVLIEAAGGAVRNRKGELLMIYRLGRWDLPKGKLEDGEQSEVCAVREVGEECAIEGAVPEKFLTHTFHIYYIKDKPVLKRTAWYGMLYTGDKTPKPQTEENIDKAEWVSMERVPEKLANSYETIRDVCREAGVV